MLGLRRLGVDCVDMVCSFRCQFFSQVRITLRPSMSVGMAVMLCIMSSCQILPDPESLIKTSTFERWKGGKAERRNPQRHHKSGRLMGWRWLTCLKRFLFFIFIILATSTVRMRRIPSIYICYVHLSSRKQIKQFTVAGFKCCLCSSCHANDCCRRSVSSTSSWRSWNSWQNVCKDLQSQTDTHGGPWLTSWWSRDSHNDLYIWSIYIYMNPTIPGKFPLPAQSWKFCGHKLKFPTWKVCSRHLKLLFDRHLTRQYLLSNRSARPLGR